MEVKFKNDSAFIVKAVDKTMGEFITLAKEQCGIKLKKETLSFAKIPLENFLEAINEHTLREFYKNSDTDSLTYSNVWNKGQKEFFVTLQFTGPRCRIGFYKQKKGEVLLINMLQQKTIDDSKISFFEVGLQMIENK